MNVTMMRVRLTILCRGKTVRVTYSEYVFVALSIQHAMRMRHIVICGLSDPDIFLHIISKRQDFRGENTKLLNRKCVSVFCTTYV